MLGGQKIKQRKRYEKVKNDPVAFAEAVIKGLNETDGSVDDIYRYLDQAGGQLDYRRYAEPLFDILIVGGTLAPGGKVESNPTAEMCVFTCEPMVEALRGHLQIFTKLIRRYKYLLKSLEEEMKKVLKFLKAFSEDSRRSLAIFTALCFSDNLISAASVVSLMTTEVLVKEGLSLQFATSLFQTWVTEKGISHISSALRKASLERRLLELLPPTKQTPTHFDAHFSSVGLESLVRFRQAQQNASYKRKLREEIEELIGQEAGNDEIIDRCHQHLSATSLSNVDVTVMLWRCIMSQVEWNKKEELVAEQALKHLKVYTELFLPFCEQGTPQLTLLIKMQEYCYDNMNFMKTFHKIALLFYKSDVITEQAILKWYSEAHVSKGKNMFLAQMRPIVEWLETAEEEDEEEEADSEQTPAS